MPSYCSELFDYIGSQRLRIAMNNELENLRHQHHLQVSAACFRRLQVISPATMDRFCRTERHDPRHRRGGTKPGALPKHQIQVRTFVDWDDKRPGFEEMDLAQHDGGNPSGFFACTLTVTDVCLGWTEMRDVATKAQTYVFAALEYIRGDLPFPLLGIDSDNGAEFINDELIRYCDREQLRSHAFTRRTQK